MTLREHTGRTVEFRLLERNTNIDFAEDWLNAGALQRDVDGAYLVDSIDYILDYVKDAISQQPRLNRLAGYRRGLRGNP